jgi:hypothetical protein
VVVPEFCTVQVDPPVDIASRRLKPALNALSRASEHDSPIESVGVRVSVESETDHVFSVGAGRLVRE